MPRTGSPPVHPVGMARLELADLSLPKRALYHLSYIPKTDVQVKGVHTYLIPQNLNHKQQPQSGIEPVFPVHV